MRRLSTLIAVPVVALVLAGAAAGSPHGATVCAHGCAYTSIQAAISAASPGATITIAPGKYVENLVVDRPLTLLGSGNGTVLYPAVSGPTCAGGSLCAGGSNMILVQSSDVTIESLRLEGDNPALTSGVVAGGADIDARNGIITDHTLGVPITNLTVRDVTVADIYLRGIYASTGNGTFAFTDNRVDNVQADPASIAIFAFTSSGVMSGNRVTHASDAISANWSNGIQFLDNDVSQSASGIHTDNSGEFGSTDLIRGNRVHDCTTDGYGIWVFAPYSSPTVDGNRVSGCAVGLAVFGSQAAGAAPTFSNNDVNGDGAQASGSDGTYGAYIATDLLGYGTGDATATLTGNRFAHFTTGLFVTQTRMFYGGPGGSQATVTAHGDSFVDNGTGANGDTGTVVDASGSWWGCKAGPNAGGDCDTAVGTVQYTPWLTTPPGFDGRSGDGSHDRPHGGGGPGERPHSDSNGH